MIILGVGVLTVFIALLCIQQIVDSWIKHVEKENRAQREHELRMRDQ